MFNPVNQFATTTLPLKYPITVIADFFAIRTRLACCSTKPLHNAFLRRGTRAARNARNIIFALYIRNRAMERAQSQRTLVPACGSRLNYATKVILPTSPYTFSLSLVFLFFLLADTRAPSERRKVRVRGPSVIGCSSYISHYDGGLPPPSRPPAGKIYRSSRARAACYTTAVA